MVALPRDSHKAELELASCRTRFLDVGGVVPGHGVTRTMSVGVRYVASICYLGWWSGFGGRVLALSHCVSFILTHGGLTEDVGHIDLVRATDVNCAVSEAQSPDFVSYLPWEAQERRL